MSGGFFERRIRSRYGFDLYLLHSREDAGAYVDELAARLREKGFACVLGSGPLAGPGKVPRASRLLFIASPATVLGDSGELERELRAFQNWDLPVTRIRLPGYTGEDWNQCRYSSFFTEELVISEDALKIASPSEALVKRIELLCRHERNTLRRLIGRSMAVRLLAFLCGVLLIWTAFSQVSRQRDKNRATEQFAAKCESHSERMREAFGRGERWQGNRLLWERSLLAWQGASLGGGIPQLRKEPPWIDFKKEEFGPLGSFLLPMKVGEISPPLRHDGAILCLTYSPGGALLATGGADGFVAIWDSASGRLLHLGEISGGAIYALAFDPSGKRLAASGADRAIRVWDAEKGTLQRTFLATHLSPVCALCFHPGGSCLVSAGKWDGVYKTWEFEFDEPRQTRKHFSDYIEAVAFNPRGDEVLVAGSEGWARYDAFSGVELSRTMEEGASTFQFSPDGQRLAVFSSQGRLTLHSAEGQVIHRWEVPRARRGAVTPPTWREGSGEWLVCADGVLSAFSAPSSQGRTVQDFSRWGSAAAAFHPFEPRVALACGNQVEVIDIESKSPDLPASGHRSAVTSLRFSQDGATLLSASSDGTVRTWAAAEGSLSGYFGDAQKSPFLDAAFALGDTVIIGCGTSLSIWDRASGQPLRPGAGLAAFRALGIGEASSLFVSLDDHDVLECWDARTGRRIARFKNDVQKVHDFWCSREGDQVITTGDPAAVLLWDAPKGEFLRQLCAFESQPGAARAIAVHPLNPSQLAVGFNGHDVVLRNLESDEIRSFDRPRFSAAENFARQTSGALMSRLAFSPDGSLLACCGADDTVLVWETANGTLKCRLIGSAARIGCFVFSPDGQFLVAGGDDGTISFWNLGDANLTKRIMREGGSLTGAETSRSVRGFGSRVGGISGVGP